MRKVLIIFLLILVILVLGGFLLKKRISPSEVKIEKPRFEEEPKIDYGSLEESPVKTPTKKSPVPKSSPAKSLSKEDLKIEIPKFGEFPKIDYGSIE